MANAATTLPARKRYRKDIVLVIVLKLVALFALWLLFFSNPMKIVIPAQAGIHLSGDSFVEK